MCVCQCIYHKLSFMNYYEINQTVCHIDKNLIIFRIAMNERVRVALYTVKNIIYYYIIAFNICVQNQTGSISD